MIVVDYYNESNIKKIRRKDILEKCSKYFVKNGIEAITMKEIAEFLNVERRTLYAYYNNKTDLFLDTNLYLTELFFVGHNAFETQLRQSLEDVSIRTQLKQYFTKYMEEMMYSEQRNSFLLNFDSFIRGMTPDSNSANRFKEVSARLVESGGLLDEILRRGFETGEIRPEYRDLDQLRNVLDQSFRAYFIKTITRKTITDRYEDINIKLFIDVLVNGVCV